MFSNLKLIVAVYVDDIIIVGNNPSSINEFKACFSKRFKTKDLGEVKFILGIKLEREDDGWRLHQKKW